MARPKPDPTLVREQMLLASEDLLARHGPAKLTVTDVAAAVGMSQSYAYRFFASKQSLLEALGERWLAGIEAELVAVAAASDNPAERFVRFIARQYELKRNKALADPRLFKSYLDLGITNTAVVERHLARLSAELEKIMADCAAAGLIAGRDPVDAAHLAEALTVRFREPALVLQHLATDTPRMAAEAAGIIFAGLAQLPR